MKDKTMSNTELNYISRRWHYKMDWCAKNGLAPANPEVWNRAEAAWIAMNLSDTNRAS